MIDRLRDLLDRPLEPRVARAIVAMAACVTVGFAIVAGVLGVGGSLGPRRPATSPAEPSPPAAAAVIGVRGEPAPNEPMPPVRQDPQDRRGTAVARHARREVRGHRALQHVPYRRHGLRIAFVGARRGRAVLRISAASGIAARHGWHQFLRRYGDSGHSYLPIFQPNRRGQ